MLQWIQDHIEQTYNIDTGVTINDYLVNKKTCEEMLKCATTRPVFSSCGKGFVFLSQINDILHLAVYLDEEVISTCNSFNSTPIQKKDFNNIVTAIEEVSHFVYAVWNASQDRQITKFEMELQGEVDKYLTVLLCSNQLRYTNALVEIKDNLFYNFSYNDTLSSEEVERYSRANKIALQYCGFLETEFIQRYYFTRLIEEVRTFYRLTQNGKLNRVRQAVGY